jgi:hypothetical protein
MASALRYVFYPAGRGNAGSEKELGITVGSRQLEPGRCGHSLMVKFQPSKLAMRVRFPLPACFGRGY